MYYFTKEITYNGETKTIKEWADQYNIKPGSLYARINRGWPLDKAFQKKVIYCCDSCNNISKLNYCYPCRKRGAFLIRRIIIHMLGGKCSICGYNKYFSCLSIKANPNKHDKYTIVGYSEYKVKATMKKWETILKETENAKLVCPTCFKVQQLESSITKEKEYLRSKFQ